MRGEYVTIVDKMDDQGWWKGTSERGETGIFPSNFIQILEEKHAPPRRSRPPTIKTDQPQQPSDPSGVISPSLARPPPVPVSTRPATLLTKRTSVGTDAHPPRPLTSPPLPTRRPPSVTAEPKKTHKPRTPSIPLISPDLPPINTRLHEGTSHEFASPVRPSRPVPTPAAPPRSDGADARPPVPNLAKPPKVMR
ncbi:hypothetical protein BX666DRAFT_126181 [Dichotomocladium elegans]|nr:hypothetical protein BX666DRAFT_126181 [Dichotomocladium elegans]